MISTRRFVLPTFVAALAAASCVAGRPAPGGPAPASWQQTMLAQVNGQRAAANAPALAWCASLARSAQGHSVDQAAHNTMTHTGSDGSTFVQRDEGAGYLGWSAIAENVAYGYPSVDAVMAGWMGSSGHRANILNSAYTHFGAGLASSSSGQPYWTQEFGRSGTC